MGNTGHYKIVKLYGNFRRILMVLLQVKNIEYYKIKRHLTLKLLVQSYRQILEKTSQKNK